MKYNFAVSALHHNLHKLFNQAEITRLLDLTEPRDDEFWEEQRHIVVSRFYTYLLNFMGWDLTLDRLSLSVGQATEVNFGAEYFLRAGITYEKVRQWWLLQGQFIHKRAFEAKRERDYLKTMSINVLCFFEGKRPLWLAFEPDNTVKLVENKDEAFAFPVFSITDLDKAVLLNAANDFSALCREVGATHVKVLPGHQPQ